MNCIKLLLMNNYVKFIFLKKILGIEYICKILSSLLIVEFFLI